MDATSSCEIKFRIEKVVKNRRKIAVSILRNLRVGKESGVRFGGVKMVLQRMKIRAFTMITIAGINEEQAEGAIKAFLWLTT